MKLLHTLVLLPFLAATALAGGLDPARVDAQARWVGHFDLQRFHDSQVWQAMLQADEKNEIELGLSHLFTTQGIDLFRDVHDATIYGTVADDEQAVALFSTNAGAEPAIARWYEKVAARPVEVGGVLCMEWGEEARPAISCLRVKPDSEERLLVVSHSRTGMAQALDVLAGSRASLASQPSTEISTTLAPGTFAFFAATDIERIHGMGTGSPRTQHDLHGHEIDIGLHHGPHSAIARLAQGLRFEMGEEGGRIFFDAHVKTAGEEDARKLQDIVQGLMALASFMGDEPEVQATLGRWIRGVQVTRTERTLRLSFSYDLPTMIREARVLGELERERRGGDEK
jgi:hypothetical protein